MPSGVHIFTANQLVDSNSRHKRSTNPLAGGFNSTLLHNTSDPHSTEENSTSLPVVSDTLDVTDTHFTTDTTKRNQDPSQTSTISLRNSVNETSTKVPNTISDQNVVTKENAQNDTAENTKVSVINTTLSIAKESRPHDEVTTPHVRATSEDGAQSSDSSVFVVPQTKVPFVSSSTVLSTATAAVIVTGKINFCTTVYDMLSIILSKVSFTTS